MTVTVRQRALANAVGIFCFRVLTFVIGILLMPFMIARLGKESFGNYRLVLSFMGYLPLLTMAVGPAIVPIAV